MTIVIYDRSLYSSAITYEKINNDFYHLTEGIITGTSIHIMLPNTIFSKIKLKLIKSEYSAVAIESNGDNFLGTKFGIKLSLVTLTR